MRLKNFQGQTLANKKHRHSWKWKITSIRIKTNIQNSHAGSL